MCKTQSYIQRYTCARPDRCISTSRENVKIFSFAKLPSLFCAVMMRLCQPATASTAVHYSKTNTKSFVQRVCMALEIKFIFKFCELWGSEHCIWEDTTILGGRTAFWGIGMSLSYMKRAYNGMSLRIRR